MHLESSAGMHQHPLPSRVKSKRPQREGKKDSSRTGGVHGDQFFSTVKVRLRASSFPHKFHQHHAEPRALLSYADWRSKCPSRALRSAADVPPRLASRCDHLTSQLLRRNGGWPGLPVSGLLIRERHEPQQQVQLLVSPLKTQTLDIMLSKRHLVLSCRRKKEAHTHVTRVREQFFFILVCSNVLFPVRRKTSA